MRNFFKVMFLCLYLSNNSYLKADDESQKALAIFKTNCSKCHKGAGSSSGAHFDVLDASTMTVGKNGKKPNIIPGNPDESYLLTRIKNKSMPPKDVTVRPSDEDVKIITEWIKKGAKPLVNNEAKRAYISWLDILTSVRNDLQKLAVRDIKYIRYFSLVNFSNNAQTTSEDLRLYRAALSKAINSLSWKPNIVLPRPIDKNQLIFAIDLRTLDWDDKKKVWQTMTNNYPYGLTLDSKENDEAESLFKIQNEICKLTNCNIPIVRADWFVSNATKPPIYHNILSIPETASELEKTVNVNVINNLNRNVVNRAGFQISGISTQNRLVERHDSSYGAYWKSYDFRPNNDFSLLTTYPLGPKYEGNLYQKQAFVHDGGEIIFNLPNGLQAYMLVNGKDKRIDNGPIEVVHDKQQSFSGTSVVSNGISCMGCHKNGMLPIKDIIRQGTALPGLLGDKVNALYPKPEKMTEFIEKDEKLFLTALKESVLPFVPEFAMDIDKLKKEMPEPITKLVMAHRDDNMTLAHVAAELDFKDLVELKSVIKRSNNLIKLLPLCQPNGTIKRAEWEKYETTIEGSLFQICANALGIGKPYTLNEN